MKKRIRQYTVTATSLRKPRAFFAKPRALAVGASARLLCFTNGSLALRKKSTAKPGARLMVREECREGLARMPVGEAEGE
jgi:hypothetical protein